MRAPAELRQRRLDLAERRLVRHALEDVHGDERAVAAVRGREQRVVGGAEAQLDREADRVALERGAGGPHGVDGVLARHAYSISSKRTSRSEAKIAYDQSTRSRCEATADGEAVQARDRAREAAGDLVDRAEGVVVHQDVADVGADAAGLVAAGPRCGPCVRVSATSACGKVQNSKWSCASARSCSVVEHVLERLRLVDVAQPERGHAAQRDRRDRRRARRGDTRAARSSSPPSMRPLAAVGERPARRDSTWPERFGSCVPVPWVPVASAPASDCASMSPRLGIASPRACSSRESALQADAGLDADEAGRRVGVEHAVRARRARAACRR